MDVKTKKLDPLDEENWWDSWLEHQILMANDSRDDENYRDFPRTLEETKAEGYVYPDYLLYNCGWDEYLWESRLSWLHCFIEDPWNEGNGLGRKEFVKQYKLFIDGKGNCPVCGKSRCSCEEHIDDYLDLSKDDIKRMGL